MKIVWYILVGFFNLLMSSLKMLSKKKRELYNKRYKICQSCDYLDKSFCKICGCFVKAKTKVDKEECPKKYW